MAAAVITEDRALADSDDPTLARRFAAGEAAAFDEVVAAYQQRVARLARRLLGWRVETEDIVQDVFLAALTKARTFRADAMLWTWLTTITLNRCRQYRRRELFRRNWLAARTATSCSAPFADASFQEVEGAEKVRTAVTALPHREREAVVLYYLEELPVAQIAPLLGVSAAAVNVRLHRARAKLRSILADFANE